MNFGEVLEETAQRIPQKTALIFRDRRMSFQELNLCSIRLANFLINQGLSKGERVAIFLPNSLDFVISYFGISKIGAIPVPVDVRLKGEELHFILSDAQVKFMIIDYPFFLANRAELLENCPLEKIILREGTHEGGGVASFEEIVNNPELDREVNVQVKGLDEALYMYTSGTTTGKPKGVVLTYDNLDTFPEVLNKVLNTKEGDVWGIIMPLSHLVGPICANEVAIRGSTLVIFDQMRPDKLLEGIDKYKINYFQGVPPIFQAILRVPHIEKYNTKNLWWVSMWGTSVPLALMKEFHEKFPHTIPIQGYGLTETSPFISLMPLEFAFDKMGSIGRPVPHAEVKIVDEEDNELPTGEVGEIITRGPMVMKEYHNNPEATREMLRNGWLYTGDLGRFDQDGFLYHLGRKDDMIITGGLNVFPAEIENTLLQHPMVAEAGAVGVPDKDRGEVIKAVVTLHFNAPVSEKELIAFCRERLAPWKVPKLIEFSDSLPKTSTGKVARRLLV
jgi:long-chain acyl-CoA synthetase